MAWSRETDAVLAQVRGHIARIEDAHTRAQVAAWVRAWDDIRPDLEAALNELALQAVDGRIRRADVIRSARLRNALDTIQTQLSGLVAASGAVIVSQLDDIVQYAGGMQDRLIASQLPASERSIVDGWLRVDARQVAAIVQRTTEQITKTSFPLSDEATAAMRRELVRGIAVGENPRAVAGRMVARTEGLFNGALTRALTIARTEMLDAHRAASALSDRQNVDLLGAWVWTSALTSRTCPACWAMHGCEFPLEVEGPNDHQCGRCTRVARTKTWAELGFEGIEEPPSLMPSAADQFDALPEAEQRSILGPRRHDAWQAGDYPMDSWATKRENPSWRDSWVPSKAPAGF